jgi:hypothetical protein
MRAEVRHVISRSNILTAEGIEFVNLGSDSRQRRMATPISPMREIENLSSSSLGLVTPGVGDAGSNGSVGTCPASQCPEIIRSW